MKGQGSVHLSIASSDLRVTHMEIPSLDLRLHAVHFPLQLSESLIGLNPYALHPGEEENGTVRL